MAAFDRGVRPIGDWSMSITLSNTSMPLHGRVRPRLHPGAVEPVGERLEDDLVHERRLARPAHAGDADELADGQLDVDVLQVVLGRALRPEPAGVVHAPVGHRDDAAAGQIGARDRLLGAVITCSAVPRATTRPPCSPAPGPHVDDVVGGADRLLVVLDDDHGVSEVAQALERGQEPGVVALVQADRRLVEDVEHAHQRRADLGGEPDALRLAAREAGRRRGSRVR